MVWRPARRAASPAGIARMFGGSSCSVARHFSESTTPKSAGRQPLTMREEAVELVEGAQHTKPSDRPIDGGDDLADARVRFPREVRKGGHIGAIVFCGDERLACCLPL